MAGACPPASHIASGCDCRWDGFELSRRRRKRIPLARPLQRSIPTAEEDGLFGASKLFPADLAQKKDGSRLYVANGDSDSVSVVGCRNNLVASPWLHLQRSESEFAGPQPRPKDLVRHLGRRKRRCCSRSDYPQRVRTHPDGVVSQLGFCKPRWPGSLRRQRQEYAWPQSSGQWRRRADSYVPERVYLCAPEIELVDHSGS